jgi:hypothetical protein
MERFSGPEKKPSYSGTVLAVAAAVPRNHPRDPSDILQAFVIFSAYVLETRRGCGDVPE